jgi:uncharacterized protein
MNTAFFRLIVVCLALLGAVVSVRGEDLNTVRGRMEKRIPQIDALKTQGAIGENNRGFLEARVAGASADAVVSAENADRAVVYAALGQKTGTSADEVARVRARQIAAHSAPGVWLQRENGEWYKK